MVSTKIKTYGGGKEETNRLWGKRNGGRADEKNAQKAKPIYGGRSQTGDYTALPETITRSRYGGG